MEVTIEHSFIPYNDEVTNIYFRIVNTILLSRNEHDLRRNIEALKNFIPVDDYFSYGYGAHHFWVCQRRPSDRSKIFGYRILMARF